MSKIFRDSIALTIAKFFQLFADLLSAAILSRLLSIENYGSYSQIFTIVTVVSAFVSFGLPNSVNYFLAKDSSFERKKSSITHILVLCNLIGISSSVLIWLFSSTIILYFKNEVLINHTWFFALMPWIRSNIALRENVFIAVGEVKNAVLNRVIISIIRIFIPIFLFLFNLSFSDYLVFFFVAEILVMLFVLISIRSLFKGFSKKLSLIEIKEILNFSFPLAVGLVIGSINVSLDKLIIVRYFSVEQFAVYANASREIPISAIASSIVAVMMPKLVNIISKNETEKAINLWNQTWRFTFRVCSPIIFYILTMRSEVFTLLYSEKYISGLSVFTIYNFVLFFRVIYFGMLLNALGKTKSIMISSIFSLILNVILNFILIRIIGFTGPAWATLLATAMIALYQLLESSKALKCRLISLIPFRVIGGIVLRDSILYVVFTFILYKLEFINVFGTFVSLILVFILWFLVSLIDFFVFRRNKYFA